MNPMSESLQYIARIFVPTTGDKGNNGTAYPIAPNRVITAAHVLKEERNGKAIWHNSAGVLWNQHQSTVGIDWQTATVKWNGHDEGFDVAVLETELPTEIRGYAEPSWNPPPIGAGFHLRGFAAVGKRDEDRQAVSFEGKVLAHLPIDDEIPIGVSFGPDLEAGWRGASGSPVLIDGKFYAVLVNCPFGLGASQVHAVSVQKLIRNHAFVSKAGLSPDLIQEERRREATSEVCAILKRHPILTASLIEKFREYGYINAEHDDMNAQQRSESIAELLTSERLATKLMLDAMSSVMMTMRPSLSVRDVRQMARMIGLILPITGMRSTNLLSAEGDEVLSLDAVSQTIAELALAKLEGREATFASRAESDNLRGGARGLSKKELYPPEAGPESTPHGMGNAAIRHLTSKVAIVDARTNRKIPLVQEEARSLDWDVMIRILKKRLRRFRARGGSVYFTFTKREDEESDGKLDAIAKEMKRQIRELVFVRLCGDDERYEAEYEQFESLSELLDELESFDSQSESR